MALQSLRYSNGKLEILDQLLLPNDSVYVNVGNTEDGWRVIKQMQVRGAPLIGITAALSLAVELHPMTFSSTADLVRYVGERMEYLITSRPTAVNIAGTRDRMLRKLASLAQDADMTPELAKSRLLEDIESMPAEDVAINKQMASHCVDHILAQTTERSLSVLTHCNTGSLATAGYGTALGVVRCLRDRGVLSRCYCTETRPYNQGSRLTAYELTTDAIPSTLVCDSAAAALLASRRLAAVLVGADRVVACGDTANKIGTLSLAVLARHYGVPFYVVAPSSSIDLQLSTGSDIEVEQRPAAEMTVVNGKQLAPSDMDCWNPAFDVTPASLVTGGVVTEFGVFSPSDLKRRLTDARSQQSLEQ